MQIQRLAGIVAIVIGLILLFMGFRATESFGSEVSEFFTGAPTDRAIWLIIVGVVLVLAGGIAAAVPFRRGSR